MTRWLWTSWSTGPSPSPRRGGADRVSELWPNGRVEPPRVSSKGPDTQWPLLWLVVRRDVDRALGDDRHGANRIRATGVHGLSPHGVPARTVVVGPLARPVAEYVGA